jgi:hypothetical protein
MQDKQLFEYAVIRLVPEVEREEFLNVGVLLYCKDLRFLKALVHLDRGRIEAAFGITDFTEIEKYLQIFVQVCEGGKQGGAIGQLALPSRFRWLIATRSTIFQTSPVHMGFCTDPTESLEALLERFVTGSRSK